MKYSVVATIAALAATVSAQSIPSCALGCISNVEGTGCNSGDFQCLCNSQAFIDLSKKCLCANCGPADLQTAAGLAQTVCGGFGVTIPDTNCDATSQSASASAPAETSSAPAETSSAPAETSSAPAETSSVELTTSTSEVVMTSTSSIAVVVPSSPPSNTTVSTAIYPTSSTVPVPSAQPSNGAGAVAASGALALFGVAAAFLL